MKTSVAVAAVDEAKGELLERASFPQDRSGLRSLDRWAKRFPERRWAVENAGGLGRHLAVRLAGSGESVVDVPPKLSARVRVLSSGNARKNGELDALATALAASRNERLAAVDPEAASPRCCACSPRGERTWWPSVPGRSTAYMGSLGTSSVEYVAPRWGIKRLSKEGGGATDDRASAQYKAQGHPGVGRGPLLQQGDLQRGARLPRRRVRLHRAQGPGERHSALHLRDARRP